MCHERRVPPGRGRRRGHERRHWLTGRREVAGADRCACGPSRYGPDEGRDGPVIEVVRTFIPAERWPQVQAALRGEAPTRRQQPQVVDRVRMVEIDDSDEDGN